MVVSLVSVNVGIEGGDNRERGIDVAFLSDLILEKGLELLMNVYCIDGTISNESISLEVMRFSFNQILCSRLRKRHKCHAFMHLSSTQSTYATPKFPSPNSGFKPSTAY